MCFRSHIFFNNSESNRPPAQIALAGDGRRSSITISDQRTWRRLNLGIA
jgi:hypothetical protein